MRAAAAAAGVATLQALAALDAHASDLITLRITRRRTRP